MLPSLCNAGQRARRRCRSSRRTIRPPRCLSDTWCALRSPCCPPTPMRHRPCASASREAGSRLHCGSKSAATACQLARTLSAAVRWDVVERRWAEALLDSSTTSASAGSVSVDEDPHDSIRQLVQRRRQIETPHWPFYIYGRGLQRGWLLAQARLLFHEAATPEVVDGAAAGGARRVALLRDALAHARTATELVENSTAVGARCAGTLALATLCGCLPSAPTRICSLDPSLEGPATGPAGMLTLMRWLFTFSCEPPQGLGPVDRVNVAPPAHRSCHHRPREEKPTATCTTG